MLNVPVVMLVAAAAVLIGVVVVAMGRGGELAYFQADYAPLKLDEVSATDVALLRPPTALWGYNIQATDEALSRIAHALTERDIEISALRQQVADLQSSAARRRPPAAVRDPKPPGSQAARGPFEALSSPALPRLAGRPPPSPDAPAATGDEEDER